MIYLDAAAVVTLIAGRRHGPELREFLAARRTMPMGTSTLGFVETVRILGQIGDYPGAMADVVAGFTEILVTEEVRDAAARLPAGVRTLDAVHIASAQILEDALDVLVTYDKRLYDVAQSIGLPVAAPGVTEAGRKEGCHRLSRCAAPRSRGWTGWPIRSASGRTARWPMSGCAGWSTGPGSALECA